MKVFISWSGEQSKTVALALRRWIRLLIQAAEPWMSEEDIGAGRRWNDLLSQELSDSKFGIVCLTKENLQSPWLMYEAGAIAKTFTEARVCPYLVGLRESDIPRNHPLTQFQTKASDQEGTRDVMLAINSVLEVPVPSEILMELFGKFWPDLNGQLASSSSIPVAREPVRPSGEVLEELLSLVRDLHRRPSAPSEVDLRNARSHELAIGIASATSTARATRKQFRVAVLKYLEAVEMLPKFRGIKWHRKTPDRVFEDGDWVWEITDGLVLVLHRWGLQVKTLDFRIPNPYWQGELINSIYQSVDDLQAININP